MRENRASITIPAPPHEVWKVLTDLESYQEWNPMFVKASGTVTVGESLHITTRLPSKLFCGAPLSSSWSPRITKTDPNSCLEWFSSSSFFNTTHYFQLASTQGGAATEFTQGERYEGWGVVFYSGTGSVGDARRGLVAMNNALNRETIRRKALIDNPTSGLVDGKSSKQDQDAAQLDISDPVALSGVPTSTPATQLSGTIAITNTKEATVENVASPTINTTAKSTNKTSERNEKRSSIIGAMSSLFSPSRLASPDNAFSSTSRDDLISKTVPEEHERDEEEYEDEKNAREAKNAERIELDFGPSSMDLGDFGF
ncbi:MAG: hypothetical protein J3Q66DRAFT_350311 [Benniella sp.]|nr:MAG: hypothetical protein J3Q66DRAFT_350311 [Benniella sp.]